MARRTTAGVTSAKADQDSKLTGLRKGADAYLTKPFHEEELKLRLENLLSLRDALHARYQFTGAELPAPKDEVQEQEDAFIQQVRAVIMDRLSDPELNVASLCQALGMARTPLHNKLKALTGKSTTEFVRYIRLNEAHRLLQTTELNVSEVAYQSGFQNPNYFTRKFREVFGQTPSEVR